MTIIPIPQVPSPAAHGAFSLHAADGSLLATLPMTIRFGKPLGEPDYYDWDRSPFSPVPIPIGDNLWKQRPTVLLEGEWTYPTLDYALADVAAIKEALPLARQLFWCGVKIADLDPAAPGSFEFLPIGPAHRMQETLTLNPTLPVTAADLEAAIGNTGSPAPGSGAEPAIELVLPYIWPELTDPATYAAPVTVDFLAKLSGKATRAGVIENLGSAPFEVVLITAEGEQPPLVVLPQTSRDLMPGLTGVRILPAVGEVAEPQLEVQP